MSIYSALSWPPKTADRTVDLPLPERGSLGWQEGACQFTPRSLGPQNGRQYSGFASP